MRTGSNANHGAGGHHAGMANDGGHQGRLRDQDQAQHEKAMRSRSGGDQTGK